MLENERFWLVIIIYFRVLLFHKVWWMGFEKGNIQFTPLHKYNYYNLRWQSYLNIKSESEKMWVTGLEVARTGRWKHRYARGTCQRMDRAEPLIGLWLRSQSEKGPQDNRPLFSERGKGMLNAQEQRSFCSSEFFPKKSKHPLRRKRYIALCSGCSGTPHLIVLPRDSAAV